MSTFYLSPGGVLLGPDPGGPVTARPYTNHAIHDAMTEPLSLPAAAPRLRHRRQRRPVAMVAACVAALGLAVAVAAIAVSGLASGPALPATSPTPVAVEAPPSLLPLGGPAAPSSPAPAPRPSPNWIDQSGQSLPGSMRPAIESVFIALRSGDLTALSRLYRPSPESESWTSVAPRLRMAVVRSKLVAAMQSRAARGEDVDVLYSGDGVSIGFSSTGRFIALSAGQSHDPAGASSQDAAGAANRRGTSGASDADPYGCVAADRALAAGTISYAQHPCASHFQDSADPSRMQPDTPATRWALCHQPAQPDDADYVRAGRARYCH